MRLILFIFYLCICRLVLEERHPRIKPETDLAGGLAMSRPKLNYATPSVTLALLRPPAMASSMSLEEFLLIRPNSGPALKIHKIINFD
jgi:hypothetical protein